jgi:hypothetical protein
MNIDYHALLPINGKKFKQGSLVATVVNIPGPQQNSNNIPYLTRFDGLDRRMINLWVAEETLRLNPNAHREVFKAIEEWLNTAEGYSDAPDRFFDETTKSLIPYDREKGPIRDERPIPESSRLNLVLDGLDDAKARSLRSAWAIQDENTRIGSLLDLAEELPPPKAEIVYLDLLEKILQAPSVQYRRETIARLTPHLNERLLTTLIDELKKEPNEDDRVRLFDFVFPFLTLAQLESLASYAETLTNETVRNLFLARIAESLARKGSINPALSIAEILTEPSIRDETTSKILLFAKRRNAAESRSSSSKASETTADIPVLGELKGESSAVLKITSRALADVANEELDLLDFGEYADALAELISYDKTEKPLTIGIDAPWGMGKTQLMKMVRKRLTHPVSDQLQEKVKGRSRFPTVWFNAWKYDREDALWAALILEILDQSTRTLPLWEGRRLRLRLKLRRVNWFSFAGAVGLSLLGLLMPLGIVLFARHYPEIGYLLLTIGIPVGVLSFAGAYQFVKGVLQQLKTLQQDLSKYMKSPDYQEKIGFLAQFELDLERVIDIVTENGKWPLVVFIDDLDRCGPAEAIEIVEAINILLESKHCVFVIGMDTRSVARSIQSKYQSLEEVYVTDPGGLTLGERFLEKILQINFKIPPTQKHQLERLIEKHLAQPKEGLAPAAQLTRAEERKKLAEKLIQAEQRGGQELTQATEIAANKITSSGGVSEDEILQASKELSERAFEDDERVQQAIGETAPYLGLNPRKIKKFINNFRLHALIAQKRGLLRPDGASVGLLAKAVVISMRWPEFASSISNDSRICQKLKNLFVAQQHLQELESSPSPDANEILTARIAFEKLKNDGLDRFIHATDLDRLLNTIDDINLERFADCFNLPATKT